jgi:hypothetical protein
MADKDDAAKSSMAFVMFIEAVPDVFKQVNSQQDSL